jgi:hypothetical protein
MTRAVVDMDRKAMGEVCLDDRENAHQHWQIAHGVRVGEKWSAPADQHRTSIGSRIAVEAPNSYSDGWNRRLSGECRLRGFHIESPG